MPRSPRDEGSTLARGCNLMLKVDDRWSPIHASSADPEVASIDLSRVDRGSDRDRITVEVPSGSSVRVKVQHDFMPAATRA